MFVFPYTLNSNRLPGESYLVVRTLNKSDAEKLALDRLIVVTAALLTLG